MYRILESIQIKIWIFIRMLLSVFLHPDPKSRIIQIGFGGLYYAGNLKTLHEALKKRNQLVDKPIRLIWVTQVKKDVNAFKKLGIETYWRYSILHLPLLLKTHVWLSDHGIKDIPAKKHRNSYWVQVWHGIPFKGFKGNKNLRDTFNTFDLHPVSSEWLAEYYRSAIQVKPEKIKTTGYPRTDDLINNVYDIKKIRAEYGFSADKKTILYAPTWAQDSSGSKPLFPWGDDESYIQEFIKFINANNLQCIIRTHPNWDGMTPSLQSAISNAKNLILNSAVTEPDTNKCLVVSDICMTDFSSIVNDYLALDRPLIFLEPHTNLFKDGFALGPEDRAGIIVKTKDTMYDAITQSIQYPDEFAEKRSVLAKKVHCALDGRATERTLIEIEKGLTTILSHNEK